MSKLFTAEQEAFYRDHCRNVPYKEQIMLMKEKFGIRLTVSQIKSWRSGHAFYGNLTGRFEKGHIPHTALEKGQCTTLKNGYAKAKGDGRTAVYRNRYEYERLHGKIPPGHAVIFLNGDKTDYSPDNLMVVTRRELATLNRNNALCGDKDISRAAAMRVRLRCAIKDRRRDA